MVFAGALATANRTPVDKFRVSLAIGLTRLARSEPLHAVMRMVGTRIHRLVVRAEFRTLELTSTIAYAPFWTLKSLGYIWLGIFWDFPNARFVIYWVANRTVQKVCFANHHRRIVTIPFRLSVIVFVWVASAQDILLDFGVLKLWLWEHILEIVIALGYRRLQSCLQYVFAILHFNYLITLTLVITIGCLFCFFEAVCVRAVTLGVLLHSHHW